MRRHLQHIRILGLVAVLSLGGCVEQRQTTVPITLRGPTVPFARAGRPALTGPRIIHKTVPEDQTVTLTFATSVNPDCTTPGTPVVRVSGEPVHGVVAIVPRKGFAAFPSANPRSACNKIKIAGVGADYTPTAGFTGSDLVTLDMIFADGVERVARYLITVK